MENVNEFLSKNIKPLSVYPNPTKDIITINMDLEQNDQIQLLDLNGRLIKKLSANNINFSTRNLESGIYFFRIVRKDTVYQTKIVKY